MRRLMIVLFYCGLMIIPAVRADDNTQAEAAIEAIEQLGGKAARDDRLEEGHQVSATFEVGSDLILLHLCKLPAVGAITFNDSSKCTERGFAVLSELPNLQKLVLGKCSVTDRSANILGKIRPISLLYLGEARITDVGLTDYNKLKHLKVLDLYDTKITDRALSHLVGSPSLEELNLSGTRITDRGVMYLKELKSLKLLRLNRTEVTREGISKLEKELPKATIRW